MVKSGVRIAVTTERRAETLTATVLVKNVAAGHHFPTYVVPRVVVRAGLGLDTRIPAGGIARMICRRRLPRPGLVLRVTVTVYPDHFYTRFFEALLASGAGSGAAQIQGALETTGRSVFEIFRKDVPLG